MTLANQIIAAMPERIKVSPTASKDLLMDEINSRRSRTSSAYGSFSSASATPPPQIIAAAAKGGVAISSSAPEDTGISTPRDELSFLEYR